MKIVYCKKENEVPIRLFMKDMVGNDIQLDLLPGQLVYTETEDMTFSLRIFEKKEVVKIYKNAKKPSYLEYYCGYSPEDIEGLRGVPAEITTKEEDNTNIIVLGGLLVERDKPNHNGRICPKEVVDEMNKSLKHILDNAGEFYGQLEHPDSQSILDKAIEEVDDYKEKPEKKKKSYYKRRVGRPKKRGPKKGTKKKK